MNFQLFWIIFVTVILTNERSSADARPDQNETHVLEKQLQDETILRRQLQSLLDFGELIEGFVDRCYPKWASNRSPKSYTPIEVWQNLFLNVENPEVMFLKKELRKAGISKASFVEIINQFLKGRNEKAHYMMSPKERQDAYPELLKILDDPERLVMNVILKSTLTFKNNYGISENKWDPYSTASPTTSTPDPDAKLIKEILEETKGDRESIKLLELCASKIEYHEDDVEAALTKFIQQLNDKPGSTKIEPRAFFAHKYQAYVLFDSFDSAHLTWTNIKSSPKKVTGLVPQYLENMALKTVDTIPLLNENAAELKICEIKNPSDPSVESWDANKVIGEFQDGKIIRKNRIKELRKMADNKAVMVRFDTLESILIAYQKIKYSLKTMAAEVSITPQNKSYPGKYTVIPWNVPEQPSNDSIGEKTDTQQIKPDKKKVTRKTPLSTRGIYF
ncbi:uncharacterized protein LOC135843717 isoform X2 [Planococcus citri]|uniref:uncharacterized protein LOC135843717 isoform X2 n=1 Tax=Planococcus citri TaxID=170843 RepID=UPI0031F75BFC